MKRSPVAQRLLAIFVAGWLLFDHPLLQLWLASPWLLFLVWGGLIALVAWMMETGPARERSAASRSADLPGEGGR